ncbi:MAG: valine--tRNA ligase [Spirochaetia bacterium]|nr:valine--tRNA ligase [Spirochaetia bacterium]
MPDDPLKNETENNEAGELSSKYNPHGLEKKWYKVWENGRYFSWKNNTENLSPEKIKELKEKGKTFSIVIPPPNVTGSLHLGHALNHTIQDILTRYHRMKGDITLWVPGTDHAGIATQNVVEKLLKKENKTRWDLGREKFQERVWDWKKESGGMITHQQRELGESVDWDYERFTMDEGLSHTVRDVFVRLYNDRLIYQGERIINWCPHCVTALSNIEVEYQDRKGKLYYIKYPVVSDSFSGKPEEIQKTLTNGDFIMVATTRPETMLGDEAIAVHPDDERYLKFHGKKVWLPLVNKSIPVIADDFVDPAFGTGAVKITPAHDPNDFLAGQRHKLPLTRILDDHGKTNEKAGIYAGISREKAREKILEDLELSGYLENTEDIKHAVGECYRCQTLVEPISSLQWFVDIKPLAQKAIDVVKNGQIEFLPKRWENTYFEWMNNIQDWCISRQLWWGHRIPAYYCENEKCKHVHVAMEIPAKCEKCGHDKLKQDNDVLDTWFSSGLWPFSTLLSEKDSAENTSWPARNTELDLFYPTSVLVTGFDIIFFWVARMIMMGVHFMKDIPFRKVYIHGLVRDAERNKMSKSKGNVVNPLEKMEEYGTDAFRFFMISILPEGKDIVYDESRLKGYSAFCNKIWNTARFIKMNLPSDYKMPVKCPGNLNTFDHWILKEYKNAISLSSHCLDEFRFADYAQSVYDFFWKDFCDNYLELSKTSLKDDSQADTTRWILNFTFEGALKLLHPIMPFITEELYSLRSPSFEGQNSEHVNSLIITAPWPDVNSLPKTDDGAWQAAELMLHLIYKIRNLRGELLIPPGEKFKVALVVKSANENSTKNVLLAQKNHIMNLARLTDFSVFSENEYEKNIFSGISTPIDIGKLILDVHHLIDVEKEKLRLTKEIENLEKYIKVVDQKLSNKDFVERAPSDLINEENRKKSEAENKLTQLKELLKSFGG